MGKKKATTEPTFEESLERLEKLADELESGELKLEDAITKYEEGVKLYARCQEILAKAEKKVQLLVRDGSGALKAVPFEPEEKDADEAASNEEKGSSDDSNSTGRGARSKKTNLF